MRMGTFLSLFVLVALESRPGRPITIALGGAFVLTIATSLNAFHEIHAAAREIGAFDRILDAIPRGARVVELDFVQQSERTHVSPWVHAVAYHRARAGGVSAPSFSVLGHWPIQFRPEAAPPAKGDDFWEFSPCLLETPLTASTSTTCWRAAPSTPSAASRPGPCGIPSSAKPHGRSYAKLPGPGNLEQQAGRRTLRGSGDIEGEPLNADGHAMSNQRRELFAARTLLGLVVLGAACSFGRVDGFPLDDAWIHQVVARTLAESGTLGYSPGAHGAAVTSALWPGLLAINFRWLHVDPALWAFGINVVATVAAAQIAFSIFRRPSGRGH